MSTVYLFGISTYFRQEKGEQLIYIKINSNLLNMKRLELNLNLRIAYINFYYRYNIVKTISLINIF